MPSTLKLVILYDARNNVYRVCDHNLEPEPAEKSVTFWRERQPSLSGLVVDQSTRHAEPDAQHCSACRRTVERASGLTPKPKFGRMEFDMTAKKKEEPAQGSLPTARKPWKKRTPIEVVFDQIEKVREDVAEQEEKLKLARRELQKLEEAKKLLEAK